MAGKSRESFLDRLRVLATCAVVMLHTITGVMDNVDMSIYPLERTVFLVAMDWLTWCVPVFVLISGYLFLEPDRKISFKQMLVRYCRRIVLALFLFGVPYACLELIARSGTFRLEMAGQSVRMVLTGNGWSHMWYLYLILFLYLITPALRHMLAKLPGRVIYLLLAILFVGSSVLPFWWKVLNQEDILSLPDGGIYLFYYICGYLFHENRKTKQIRTPKDIRYGKGYPLVLIVLLLVGMMINRLAGDSLQMAYNYPATVLLSLLIFGAGHKWESWFREKRTETWKQISSLTFAIYLIHPVFVNISYKFLRITPLGYPIGISLPLFFLIILLLSAAGSWILCRIPILRKYVL